MIHLLLENTTKLKPGHLCCPFLSNKLMFPLVLLLFPFPPDQFLAVDTVDPIIPCDLSSLTNFTWSLDHSMRRKFSLARNLDALKCSQSFILKVILIVYKLLCVCFFSFYFKQIQFGIKIAYYIETSSHIDCLGILNRYVKADICTLPYFPSSILLVCFMWRITIITI